MEIQRYIGTELSSSKVLLGQALQGLSREEAAWRPASGCNSIGLILFHMARTEDSLIQGLLQKTELIWDAEKWHDQLGMAREEAGSHYTVDQVNAFKVPDLSKLLAYYEAVRAKTKEKLRSMPVEAFDEKITFPHVGEMTIGAFFAFMISHTAEHIGQISYLRGLQRGMDK